MIFVVCTWNVSRPINACVWWLLYSLCAVAEWVCVCSHGNDSMLRSNRCISTLFLRSIDFVVGFVLRRFEIEFELFEKIFGCDRTGIKMEISFLGKCHIRWWEIPRKLCIRFRSNVRNVSKFVALKIARSRVKSHIKCIARTSNSAIHPIRIWQKRFLDAYVVSHLHPIYTFPN